MKLQMKVDYYPGDRGEFIKVDEKKCTGCGDCAKFCARDVWQKHGEIYRPSKLELCAECGACWNICVNNAVVMEEPKGGTGVCFYFG